MALILLLSFSAGSYAETRAVKCRYGFVQKGDLKFKVLEKCGEPLEIEKISGDDEMKTERVTYKINNLYYSFLFYAGELNKIERLQMQ